MHDQPTPQHIDRQTMTNLYQAAIREEYLRRSAARLAASPEAHCTAFTQAVMAVRDHALQQLTAERDMLARQADKATRDYAELQSRLHNADRALLDLRDVPRPPLGASISRWWDAKITELRTALDAPPIPDNARGECCTCPHDTVEG